MSELLIIGIADMKITKASGSLITYALGSCIGICIYDPNLKLAGMAHIILPEAPTENVIKPLKYADTGLITLVRKMESMGGNRRAFVAKIAGGAKMFDIPGGGNIGNIGKRNIEAVKINLRALGIKLACEEVGSNIARTLSMNADTGLCKIKSFGHEDKYM